MSLAHDGMLVVQREHRGALGGLQSAKLYRPWRAEALDMGVDSEKDERCVVSHSEERMGINHLEKLPEKARSGRKSRRQVTFFHRCHAQPHVIRAYARRPQLYSYGGRVISPG